MESLSNENKELKKQIQNFQLTITRLQRKEVILNALCKEHKLENERIKSQLQHKYNKKQEEMKSKYENEIKRLQLQINNQTLKLQFKEKEINQNKNNHILNINNYEKFIISLQRQINERDNKIKRLQQLNSDKKMELNYTQTQLDVTKEANYNLQQKLCSEEYYINSNDDLQQRKFSDHTRKITGSSARTIGKSIEFNECLNSLMHVNYNYAPNQSRSMLSPVVSSDFDDEYPEFDDVIIEIGAINKPKLPNKYAQNLKRGRSLSAIILRNSETERSVDIGTDEMLNNHKKSM